MAYAILIESLVVVYLLVLRIAASYLERHLACGQEVQGDLRGQFLRAKVFLMGKLRPVGGFAVLFQANANVDGVRFSPLYVAPDLFASHIATPDNDKN